MTARSSLLFERALRVMPGGVSSPVRAFKRVGGTPRFMARGTGAWLEDADGTRFVDLVLSWGPLILGHGDPEVLAAVERAVRAGFTFGTPTELELDLAEAVTAAFPSIEQVRFVTSGTEAVMSAVRLARAATSRRVIVKFAGCYHGHADSFLAAAGSGVMTLGLPDSPGVNPAVAADTWVVPFNDADAVERIFREGGDRIAALVVEPVAGNMGVIPPRPGFLAALRSITEQYGALLVFDEVMTGWRAHRLGVQQLAGIRPDLTCLGKVIGGGFPAAAYGGRRELMERVAPSGPVYQAGTLAGHPVAMAAGLATLTALAEPGRWERAEAWAESAAAVITRSAERAGVPVVVQRVGTMFTPFFAEGPVTDLDSANRTATDRYAAFFHGLLDEGVYAPPSPFESWFSSTAHGGPELEVLERAVTAAFDRVRA